MVAQRIRELWRRLTATRRRARSDEDLEEELRLHVELAAEDERRRGHAPDDAARLARVHAGGVPQALERLRDQRRLPTLDALRADVVFGFRQIVRHRVGSLSAILSLGLAMGASLTAIQLIDALLLRPLPVADPSRLFVVTRTFLDAEAQPADRDDFDYPTFQSYRAFTRDDADLMLIGAAVHRPIAIGGGDPETAVQQFVSGNVFTTLGLRPSLGRLIGEPDDVVPNGHPIIVLTHDYWQRRFGGDAGVVGRTLRIAGQVYEIVGVVGPGFTGTEPGMVTDFFVPSMMNAEALDKRGWSWFRIWGRPKPGVDADRVQAVLAAHFGEEHAAGMKAFTADTPAARIRSYLSERLVLLPAGAGASGMQKQFRRPLWILTALAAMLLLIACANVANLLLARAMSRRVEMALRVSIGAARRRLIQLVLVESAMLAIAAAAAGALFAWWAAPFVVSMLAPQERPLRLIFAFDWRTVAAAAAVTLAVTMVFGLAPALRASAVTPHDLLKEVRGRRGQRRLVDALVAAQIAFCVFLLFGASLFVGSFERLHARPLGFDPDHLLRVVVEGRRAYSPAEWLRMADSLRGGSIESAAAAGWAPLTGNRWRASVTAPGRSATEDAPEWLSVSPGYFATMRMRLVEGRDFRPDDRSPRRDEAERPVPGVAIVNRAFARAYFDGRSPVGQRVIVDHLQAPMEIVGLTEDAVSSSVRDPMLPAVFVPLEARYGATLLARTIGDAGDAGDAPQRLRQGLMRTDASFQIHDLMPVEAFVLRDVIRERLLAALSTFFATLALVVAAIGVYGVFSYAVTRERRDIGLRMALGARPVHLLVPIAGRLFSLVGAGTLAGLGCGIAFARLVQPLLFQTEPTHPLTMGAPLAALALATIFAVVPPMTRAVRVDPADTIKIDA